MEDLIQQLTKNVLDQDKIYSLKEDIEKALFGFGKPKMPKIPGTGQKGTPSPSVGMGTGIRSHKYVKKDENYYGPGQHRYWYKMPDGSLKASKEAGGPEGKTEPTPKREEVPPEKLSKETKKVKDTTQKLFDEVSQRLKPEEGFKVEEKRMGESDPDYYLRQYNHALDYIDDFKNRLEKIATSSEEAKILKQEIISNTLRSMRQQLQGKVEGYGEKEKPSLSFHDMKTKMNEYEKRGLKNLSDEQSDEYFKLKRKTEKIESEEAELSQTKSSIEEQKKREIKSKEYVEDFEKVVKPANEIKAPEIKPLVTDIEKAESNGKVNKNAPKKDTLLKMNATRFLNKAFKVLKLDNVEVTEVNAKGSAMSLAIKAPMDISDHDLRRLNKLIQRQYGLTSPAQVNYKPGNIIEFTFSKQIKEDIIRPMFSDSVKDLNKYINENKTPNGLRRLAMIVGYDSKGKPIVADFTNYDVTSVATVSSPGQGKTFNAESSLMGMISNYSPEEVRLDIVDAQGVAFPNILKNASNYLDNQPGMGVKTKEDVQKVMGILEGNLQTITDRVAVLKKHDVQKVTDLPERTGDRQFPLKIIVMDEYQGLFSGIDKVYGAGSEEAKSAKAKLKNYMSDIQKQGRKVGVVPWVMTQTVDDDNSEYLQNCSTKMLYRVEDAATGQDFLGKGGRDVARNIIDVGQSAVVMKGKTNYGVGVVRNHDVDEVVTKEAGTRK